MRTLKRHVLPALLILLATACQKETDLAGPDVIERDAPAAASGSITVEVTGFKSDQGTLLVYLFASEAAFPGEYGDAARRITCRVENLAAKGVLADVPFGTYGISVIHDEDDNGKLRTNFIGIPREGVGTSNNPAPRMGPPRWKDASFVHEADQTVTIALQYP